MPREFKRELHKIPNLKYKTIHDDSDGSPQPGVFIPAPFSSAKNNIGHSFYEKQQNKSIFQKKLDARRQSQEYVPRWLEHGPPVNNMLGKSMDSDQMPKLDRNLNKSNAEPFSVSVQVNGSNQSNWNPIQPTNLVGDKFEQDEVSILMKSKLLYCDKIIKDLMKENKQLIGIAQKKDDRVRELEESELKNKQILMRLREELKETALSAKYYESNNRKVIKIDIAPIELQRQNSKSELNSPNKKLLAAKEQQVKMQEAIVHLQQMNKQDARQLVKQRVNQDNSNIQIQRQTYLIEALSKQLKESGIIPVKSEDLENQIIFSKSMTSPKEIDLAQITGQFAIQQAPSTQEQLESSPTIKNAKTRYSSDIINNNRLLTQNTLKASYDEYLRSVTPKSNGIHQISPREQYEKADDQITNYGDTTPLKQKQLEESTEVLK